MFYRTMKTILLYAFGFWLLISDCGRWFCLTNLFAQKLQFHFHLYHESFQNVESFSYLVKSFGFATVDISHAHMGEGPS